MSRQIDLSKPLSDEDRQYLVERARFADLQMNEQLLEDDADQHPDRLPSQMPQGADLAPQMKPMTSGALGGEGADEYARQAGTDASSVAALADEGSGNGSSEPYTDDEAWTYQDLKDEVAERQENYSDDNRIALNSSRPALIAWLEADDKGEHS